MPIKPILRMKAWSYSRLSEYNLCPLKASLHHLQKIDEPKGPALLRGSQIHEEAEAYATGRLKKLPDSLKLFAEEFKDLAKRRKYLQVEQQVAFDKAWKPCDWFGADAWLRVVMDAYYVDGDKLVVVDHKTGKVRPENVEQLDLYAVAGFILHPEVTTVDAQLWYLDQGEQVTRSYTLADAAKLQKVWTKKPAKMLADTTFKPTPGGGCRYCWYSQAAKVKGGGGQCKF